MNQLKIKPQLRISVRELMRRSRMSLGEQQRRQVSGLQVKPVWTVF
jgi:hypothetical protein